MRIALVAVVSAVCLVMPAHAASVNEVPVEANADGSTTDATPGSPIAEAFRLSAKSSIASAKSARDMIKGLHGLHFAHHLLEYYPSEDSHFHFSLGMQKDKRSKNGIGAFDVRGVKMFTDTPSGDKRGVSPGFGVGYDEPLGRKDTLNFDLGMRMSRNSMASRLNRLAGSDVRHELGARSSRFGPAANVSFIHTF